jgi:ribosomal protein L15E
MSDPGRTIGGVEASGEGPDRMDNRREKDEFTRIQLTARLEKDRNLVGQYDDGLVFVRTRIEDTRYELGRLDERLGGPL